jgi:hypothetical protein
MFLLQSTPIAPDWHQIAVSYATIAIAGFSLVSLVTSFGLLAATASYTKTTRDVFKAANRPYVGVTSIRTVHDKEKKLFVPIATIMNQGTTLAKNTIVDSTLIANGKVVPLSRPLDKPSVLIPGTGLNISSAYSEKEHYDKVHNAKLDLRIRIDYEGLNKQKYYCEFEAMRDPENDTFIVIGSDAN